MKLTFTLLTLIGFSLSYYSSFGGELETSTPSALKIKVYKVAFSTTGDCQNLQTVYERTADAATFVDFLNNPILAEGLSLDDGTYKCVGIEMSDLIKFTSTTADGPCAANTEYTLDVCASDNSTTSGVLLDGTSYTCSATRGTDDRVTLWLSTASTCTDGSETCSCWRKPANATADNTNGFNLASAFVKAGASTGTFSVDASNAINAPGEDPSTCGMAPPTFSFR